MEVLPDLEEVQERMANAMETVDACSGSSEADVSAVMQAANAAAIAAASASTLVGSQITCRTLSRVIQVSAGQTDHHHDAA